MLTSEYRSRVQMIHKYFINEYKWKINDDGNYVYFKSAKRCYRELRFMINIIFQDDLEIIDVEEFRNFNDKLVGYSIIGKIEVKGNFNGIYQGEESMIEYVRITLCCTAFIFEQAPSLEKLLIEK
ncbi:hypothetical protein [Clostridium perfringens]|uniref:hypothetical protein n=1 Tax=Clostridium perfringens TaxID=1502 RepID=UPI00096A9D6F|nr:hypothetical protein [Clostridium perfringens]